MKTKHFTTSDGTEFYTETNAINHARTLEDRTVTPPSVIVENIEVAGEEVETGEASQDDADKEAQEAADKEAQETADKKAQEAADKEAQDAKVNLSRLNKAQLIAFALENEIAIDETATNPVIVEAIEAQLTAKNQA